MFQTRISVSCCKSALPPCAAAMPSYSPSRQWLLTAVPNRDISIRATFHATSVQGTAVGGPRRIGMLLLYWFSPRRVGPRASSHRPPPAAGALQGSAGALASPSCVFLCALKKAGDHPGARRSPPRCRDRARGSGTEPGDRGTAPKLLLPLRRPRRRLRGVAVYAGRRPALGVRPRGPGVPGKAPWGPGDAARGSGNRPGARGRRPGLWGVVLYTGRRPGIGSSPRGSPIRPRFCL